MLRGSRVGFSQCNIFYFSRPLTFSNCRPAGEAQRNPTKRSCNERRPRSFGFAGGWKESEWNGGILFLPFFLLFRYTCFVDLKAAGFGISRRQYLKDSKIGGYPSPGTGPDSACQEKQGSGVGAGRPYGHDPGRHLVYFKAVRGRFQPAP